MQLSCTEELRDGVMVRHSHRIFKVGDVSGPGNSLSRPHPWHPANGTLDCRIANHR